MDKAFSKALDRALTPLRRPDAKLVRQRARYEHLPWLRKFLDHGNGVAIVRAYTSSNWFHRYVVPRAETLCFPNGKTKFIRPDGSVGKEPGLGVVLIGMGEIANAALERSRLGFFVHLRSTP